MTDTNNDPQYESQAGSQEAQDQQVSEAAAEDVAAPEAEGEAQGATVAEAFQEAQAVAPVEEETGPRARWYILHTFSGYEQRVEKTLQEMMRTGQDKGFFKEVVVPTEKVVELVQGAKRTSTRKFYPGYVMIKMVMNEESAYMVLNIPKVSAFLGGKNKPSPMKDHEAARILDMMVSRQEQPRPKFHFDRGDEVRVIDGPFNGFNGVVDDVNYDKGKLRVEVSIFGRQTPVELDFVQVTKG